MVNQLPRSGYLLGLDVGEKRIGAALASAIARLPQPTDLILAGPDAPQRIKRLVKAEQVTLIVVGLPRNLKGEETAQSRYIREFARELQGVIEVPVVFADESLSSVRADELMRDNSFKNVSRDSLAACFILEEYIRTTDHQGAL